MQRTRPSSGRDRGIFGFGFVFSCAVGGLSAVWWGSASFAAATLVGFLFGIPRVVQEDNPSGSGDEAKTVTTQRVNTNLEQISDWLTKIIVGFGLIELRKVPAAFESLATFVAYDSVSSPTIAGAVIIYFAAVGFFAGYLLTRLFLAIAFNRADNAKPEHMIRIQKEMDKILRADNVNFNKTYTLAQTRQSGTPPRCALVVVDIQNDFFADGALPVGDAGSLISPLNRAIRLAEEKGLLIIYTQDWHPSNHPSFESYGGSWPKHCVSGTRGAELNGDLYIATLSKKVQFGTDLELDGYSPFENLLLDYLLDPSSISQVYVVGIALEYCVLATITQAVQRNLKVTAIKSLIRAASPADSEDIWIQLAHKGVEVLDDLTEYVLTTNCVGQVGESGGK